VTDPATQLAIVVVDDAAAIAINADLVQDDVERAMEDHDTAGGTRSAAIAAKPD
jgi:hypothetical protein